MGSCFSWCKKNKSQSSAASRNGLQEPLHAANKRQSDDISLPKNTEASGAYESPILDENSASSDKNVDVYIGDSDSCQTSVRGDDDTFNDEAIPPMGPKASLTGWLHYKTGTLFTSYQRAFFVLQEGYLYAYRRPKSDASTGKGSGRIPLRLCLCDTTTTTTAI